MVSSPIFYRTRGFIGYHFGRGNPFLRNALIKSSVAQTEAERTHLVDETMTALKGRDVLCRFTGRLKINPIRVKEATNIAFDLSVIPETFTSQCLSLPFGKERKGLRLIGRLQELLAKVGDKELYHSSQDKIALKTHLKIYQNMIKISRVMPFLSTGKSFLLAGTLIDFLKFTKEFCWNRLLYAGFGEKTKGKLGIPFLSIEKGLTYLMHQIAYNLPSDQKIEFARKILELGIVMPLDSCGYHRDIFREINKDIYNIMSYIYHNISPEQKAEFAGILIKEAAGKPNLKENGFFIQTLGLFMLESSSEECLEFLKTLALNAPLLSERAFITFAYICKENSKKDKLATICRPLFYNLLPYLLSGENIEVSYLLAYLWLQIALYDHEDGEQIRNRLIEALKIKIASRNADEFSNVEEFIEFSKQYISLEFHATRDSKPTLMKYAPIEVGLFRIIGDLWGSKEKEAQREEMERSCAQTISRIASQKLSKLWPEIIKEKNKTNYETMNLVFRLINLLGPEYHWPPNEKSDHYIKEILPALLEKVKSIEELKEWSKEILSLIAGEPYIYKNSALLTLIKAVGSIEELKSIKSLVADCRQLFTADTYAKEVLPILVGKVKSFDELKEWNREILLLITDYFQKFEKSSLSRIEDVINDSVKLLKVLLSKVENVKELEEWNKEIMTLLVDYFEKFGSPDWHLEYTLPILLGKVKNTAELKEWDNEAKAIIADKEVRIYDNNSWFILGASDAVGSYVQSALSILISKAKSTKELSEWHMGLKALLAAICKSHESITDEMAYLKATLLPELPTHDEEWWKGETKALGSNVVPELLRGAESIGQLVLIKEFIDYFEEYEYFTDNSRPGGMILVNFPDDTKRKRVKSYLDYVKAITSSLNAKVLEKIKPGDIKGLREIAGNKMDKLFQALNVLADHNMLDSLLPISPSFEAEREIIHGSFDKNNPLHLLLNYFDAIKVVEGSSPKELTFEEYLVMVEEGEKGRFYRRDIPTELKLQVRAVAYEAHLLREKILEIQKHAETIGRKVMVVANLSYGEVALTPILQERHGRKTIVGTNIPVVSTKVGSTESHTNEYVLNLNLFTSSQLRTLVQQNPIVIVVDASTSVSDPHRTSPHIPDAFKGYRNYFMALNRALLGNVVPEDFGEDRDFLDGLTRTNGFNKLVSTIKKEADKPKEAQPYRLYFWYPGNKYLYLRVGKKKNTQAARLDDISKIEGPAVIFVQAAAEPDAVPHQIRQKFMYGDRHTPAFFDDKDHFKEFHLAYQEGYGVVRSKRFANLSRFYYRELANMLGVAIETKTDKPSKITKIDNVIADLDGVLVVTDEHLSGSMLKQILDILGNGKRFILETEDLEANVDERVVQYIPAALRHRLVIFSDGATRGFTFDAAGSKVYLEEYNRKSRITTDFRQRVIALLDKNFKGQFEIDQRTPRINPEFRIDLRHVKSPRNHFIEKAREMLSDTGIEVKLYKAGSTSVKVVLQHKEDAARFCINTLGIDMTSTLIMADSARTHQIDRELLMTFPEALSINVGTRARTIAQENPNILQLPEEGVNGGLRVLSFINQYGGIDKQMISSD